MKALWDEIKFSTTHCTKIDRIALVGEKKWGAVDGQGLPAVQMARIQYFDAAKIDDAWKWLNEGL